MAKIIGSLSLTPKTVKVFDFQLEKLQWRLCWDVEFVSSVRSQAFLLMDNQ